MSEWTQLWLNYERVRNDIKSVNITFSGFSEDNRVVGSMIDELRRGMYGLLGAEVSFGENGAGSSDTLKIEIKKKDGSDLLAGEGGKDTLYGVRNLSLIAIGQFWKT